MCEETTLASEGLGTLNPAARRAKLGPPSLV